MTNTCVACGSNKTTGSWLRSKTVDGGYLCVNCYYKELVALSGKECSGCKAKTTSSIWYNSKKESGKYLCARCYSRSRKELADEKKGKGQGKGKGGVKKKTKTTKRGGSAKRK